MRRKSNSRAYVALSWLCVLASSFQGCAYDDGLTGPPSQPTERPTLLGQQGDTMLFPQFSTIAYPEGELAFSVHASVAVSSSQPDFGPFVFVAADIPALNAAFNDFLALGSVSTVTLRPVGVTTGFGQLRDGGRYIDVAVPILPSDVVPLRGCTGAGAIAAGQLVTVAAALPATGPEVGLVPYPPTEGNMPPFFVGLVPLAAQILRVVAVKPSGLFEVEGLDAHVNHGFASVAKAQFTSLVGLNDSFPIAGYRATAGTPPSSYAGEAIWYDGGGTLTTFLPTGAPVLGPTLFQLLSEMGPPLTPTTNVLQVDAQIGGVVICTAPALVTTLPAEVLLRVGPPDGPFDLARPTGITANAVAAFVANFELVPTNAIARLLPFVQGADLAGP